MSDSPSYIRYIQMSRYKVSLICVDTTAISLLTIAALDRVNGRKVVSNCKRGGIPGKQNNSCAPCLLHANGEM